MVILVNANWRAPFGLAAGYFMTLVSLKRLGPEDVGDGRGERRFRSDRGYILSARRGVRQLDKSRFSPVLPAKAHGRMMNGNCSNCEVASTFRPGGKILHGTYCDLACNGPIAWRAPPRPLSPLHGMTVRCLTGA